MLWDFVEANIFSGATRDWQNAVNGVLKALSSLDKQITAGFVQQASAAATHTLPDDSAQVFATDPPYYDSVPYAELADFFYVWLRRSLVKEHVQLLKANVTPKTEQAIVWHPNSVEEKLEFEKRMSRAMSEGCRVLAPDGIGLVIFCP